MNALMGINIELTSRCNKACAMCGRRKMEREHPEACDWGDMPLEMVRDLSEQIPDGVFVQFHWNGEPLLYPALGTALDLFDTYTGMDTNGKLLVEKAGEIIDNIDTLTISVIQDDPEGEDQLNIAEEFLHMRGKETPLVTFRMLGTIDQKRVEWIEAIRASFSRVLICKRMLHDPMGSFNYERETVKPEHGVCLEMLHKLAIDRYGNVSPCVRHDPRGENRLWPDKKRIQKTNYLSDFWDGENRRQRVEDHLKGNRSGFCATCEYWGVPRG